MDEETGKRFDTLTSTVNGMKLTLEKYISLNEGLDLDGRVKNMEAEIKTKASWASLKGVAAFLFTVLGTGMAILKFGK